MFCSNMQLGRKFSLLAILYIVFATRADAVTVQKLNDFQVLEDVIDKEFERDFDANQIESFELSTETLLNSNDVLDAEKEEEQERKQQTKFYDKSSDNLLGMDTVTIIWYLTTFTALFIFFIVMACTENYCGRRRNVKPAETRTSPPTPCPSYKNFAPPSYGSVMKKLKDQRVYIVSVHEGNNNFFTNPIVDANQNDGNPETITVER